MAIVTRKEVEVHCKKEISHYEQGLFGKVTGYFDRNEVIRIMAEDGYDFFEYCN